ncbi:MAG: hypothetical protein WC859_10185 [Elusimicrobiota bacterium]
MRKKSLLATNPYLKNRAKRKSLILATVLTSAAIEGVRGLLPALQKSLRSHLSSSPSRPFARS